MLSHSMAGLARDADGLRLCSAPSRDHRRYVRPAKGLQPPGNQESDGGKPRDPGVSCKGKSAVGSGQVRRGGRRRLGRGGEGWMHCYEPRMHQEYCKGHRAGHRHCQGGCIASDHQYPLRSVFHAVMLEGLSHNPPTALNQQQGPALPLHLGLAAPPHNHHYISLERQQR